MIAIPPFLAAGDTIGVVCPAGYMALERTERCTQQLRAWGFQVRIGNTVGGSSENYFSGTDEERLHDFQQMLDDDGIRAILCGRGGYGLGRIIDRISFKKFKKQPKWIIGYSDISILHAHLYSNYKIASIHGPMAGAFNDAPASDPFTDSLKHVLAGIKPKYECAAHPLDRAGSATGELVGGNLTLLSNAIGTASDLKTKDRILFIEDIGEYLYGIDRMLHQLKRADKLSRLAALVVGRFTNLKDTDRPFGQPVEALIRDLVSSYDYPVCFGFPVGHGTENVALKHGVSHQLTISFAGTVLEEI